MPGLFASLPKPKAKSAAPPVTTTTALAAPPTIGLMKRKFTSAPVVAAPVVTATSTAPVSKSTNDSSSSSAADKLKAMGFMEVSSSSSVAPRVSAAPVAAPSSSSYSSSSSSSVDEITRVTNGGVYLPLNANLKTRGGGNLAVMNKQLSASRKRTHVESAAVSSTSSGANKKRKGGRDALPEGVAIVDVSAAQLTEKTREEKMLEQQEREMTEDILRKQSKTGNSSGSSGGGRGGIGQLAKRAMGLELEMAKKLAAQRVVKEQSKATYGW